MPAAEENISEENRQSLLDMFGEDTCTFCIKKTSIGPGILLDKSQYDILDHSRRISTQGRRSAYKESYGNSFLVHANAEDGLKVPSFDGIVETFLINTHSVRAVVKRNWSF